MKELKYLEILKLNQRIEGDLISNPYNITVLSNITVNQIKEILEYSLRSDGINANVVIGNYDNIAQDSIKFQETNVIIIFWELSNIVDGLQYKVELLNDEQLEEIVENTKSEIDFVLKNLQSVPLILFNSFTSLHFTNLNVIENNFNILAVKLNKYLEEKINENNRLVDLEKVIVNVGLEKSIDHRYYLF